MPGARPRESVGRVDPLPPRAMRSRYFVSHSVLGIVIAIGEPRVRPCRTPLRISNAVGLEASGVHPGRARGDAERARRRSPWRTGTPAGIPSSTADQRLPVRFPGGEHPQHGAHHRDRTRRAAAPRHEVRGRPQGAAPATGDRSPRGRAAAAQRYFCALMQSVNGSSPKRNVAQFPRPSAARTCHARTAPRAPRRTRCRRPRPARGSRRRAGRCRATRRSFRRCPDSSTARRRRRRVSRVAAAVAVVDGEGVALPLPPPPGAVGCR